ncbi:MAG: YraN family protein [bacterium]
MTKKLNLTIGQLGEKIAREYLENKGYKIIAQNYRTKYAEIDLITEKDKTLVLVEVRTKTGEIFGQPEETINKKKILKLKRNALAYAAKIGWRGIYRIDAVCVVLDKNCQLKRINHYADIC